MDLVNIQIKLKFDIILNKTILQFSFARAYAKVPLVRNRDMRIPVAPEFGGSESRTLSPADRVSQKGPDACRTIIEGMIAGTTISRTDRLLLVDMNPNYAGDWEWACWHMMKAKLSVGGDGPFPGLLCFPGDEHMTKALTLAMHRTLCDEWWDHNPDAGPRDPAPLSDSDKPNLQIATWTATSAMLPDAWVCKFDDASDHHGPWMELCGST